MEIEDCSNNDSNKFKCNENLKDNENDNAKLDVSLKNSFIGFGKDRFNQTIKMNTLFKEKSESDNFKKNENHQDDNIFFINENINLAKSNEIKNKDIDRKFSEPNIDMKINENTDREKMDISVSDNFGMNPSEEQICDEIDIEIAKINTKINRAMENIKTCESNYKLIKKFIAEINDFSIIG